MSPLGPYLPEDFDEFWQETVAETTGAKLDFHRSFSNDFDLPGFKVETISFQVLGDRALQGWLAVPEGGRNLPGFVWVPPYGRESLLPNGYGTREGYASLSFNFFGHGAFHQEQYRRERGYFAEGAADPRTWVFRRMIQDAIFAVRVLQSQHEVDADRIGAMGMSQGAGIAIWLGAMCEAVKVVCADMPFLCNVRQTLERPVHRYPLKELTDFMQTIPVGEERVFNTVSYFDSVNLATHCKVPTHVSLGLKDPSCKPDHVRACFKALPGTKTLVEYPGGHDWHEEMIETNRRWLETHL